MKKNVVIFLLVTVGVIVGLIFHKSRPIQKLGYTEQAELKTDKEHEERPKLTLSAEEKAVNKRRQERSLKAENALKSVSNTSSYADGQITGTWEQFRFLTYDGSPYGFRTVGSVYDQANDVIYAISYAGHIWKINRESGDDSKTDWEVMNHTGNFSTSYIDGLNKADQSFRMIRSAASRMQYSDNEGKEWINASGVQFTANTYEGAIVKTENGNKVFVLVKTSSNNQQVYVSSDDGTTYLPLSTKFNPSSYYVKMFRVHNSESVFLAVYNYADSKVSIYEHAVDAHDFTLVNTSSNTFVSLDRIFGTYYNGNYHFYVATKYSNIYYSTDKGASWTHKQIDISNESGDTNARDVHPNKPNVIVRGYLDANVSINYGTSFSNFGHRLGWDVHHMKFYKRKDNSCFFFLGKDFGCYISDTPELWSSYVSLNYGAPAQMCYDADHGQNYYSSFTSTQDRGTVGFLTSSNEAVTEDVRTTDGLRVTLANNDASVWTWMYFGTIYHKSNFLAENSGLISINYPTGNWWAAPMIPSPNKNEDAVYLAYGNNLSKLTFNPEQQSIIQTKHYFDFEKETGSEITGFGYSPINTKRWYVSVKNGVFLYSLDGGQTFEKTTYLGSVPKANDQSYNYHRNQHIIRASNMNEEVVYYAGVGKVFLISQDGGKTFTNHNNGLDVYRIRDFDLSADEKFIYAACGSGGIWVYSVDDDRWYEMNDASIPYVEYTDVEFITKQNAVKFATYGSGILTFKIDENFQNIIYPDNLVAEVGSEGTISLQWEDNSDNEEGFIIERARNGVFQQVASVSANTVSYIEPDVLEEGSYQYRVKAFHSNDESYYSNYVVIKAISEGTVSKKTWTLVSVDSEDYVNPQLATYAFDDNPGTFWFTQWSGGQPPYPHEIVIDMNETHSFIGFSYMPRQDGKTNGSIKDYEFYISNDNATWTKAGSGTWEGSSDLKEVYFSGSKNARYIKLVGLSGVNGTNFASCAELSILTKRLEPTLPNAPQFVQGGRLSDTQIELVWMDLSKDEKGFVVEQFVDNAFTPIYTSGKDATTYNLQNTNKDETYWFRVYAFNDIGNSAYSDTITIGSKEFSNVGIYDLIDEEDIKIYPNPFINELHISYEISNLFSEWELLDMSGRMIKKGDVSEYQNQVSIRVQDIIPGVYIVRLSGEKGSISKTVIKK
ncbi:discoidin domain-containing protein [Saccharicrinis sp. GN24d3]|uniref:discoidin domain-containing protein n=1 Tax=Saccharicrinis sp. GN24d3 TaxID=3458416 RepID=UPI0040359D30